MGKYGIESILIYKWLGENGIFGIFMEFVGKYIKSHDISNVMNNEDDLFQKQIKMLKEKIKVFTDYIGKNKPNIQKINKDADEKLKMIKKVKKWRDLNNFLDNEIDDLEKFEEISSEYVEEIKDNCERLQQSFQHIKWAMDITIDYNLPTIRGDKKEFIKGMQEYIKILKKYQDIYLIFRHELLPKAERAVEKYKLLWNLINWKSNLIQSLKLNKLTWAIAIFTVVIVFLSILFYIF